MTSVIIEDKNCDTEIRRDERCLPEAKHNIKKQVNFIEDKVLECEIIISPLIWQ